MIDVADRIEPRHCTRARPGPSSDRLAPRVLSRARAGSLGVEDGGERAGRLRALDAYDAAQPPDRIANAHRRVAGGAGPAALLAARGQPVLEHLRVAHDDGERVVD